MKPTIIIGAGVAGLAAAIRSAELGVPTLVIEASAKPSQKVCGEFLSPECLPTLEHWGIEPAVTIPHVRFVVNSTALEFAFPVAAGGLSRLSCETRLVERAVYEGVEMRWSAKVAAIRSLPKGHYEVEFETGEKLAAGCLLVGAGRLSQWMKGTHQSTETPPPARFVGIKAHFTGINMGNWLEMHLLPGAYLGISPVEDGETNIACLATADCFKALGGSPDRFWTGLLGLASARRLRERIDAAPRSFEWLSAQVPGFGERQQPDLPNAIFIGDAMGSIPPISGDGLAMAIAGGCMAAEYGARGETDRYRQDWKRRFGQRLRWAQWIQACLLRPSTARLAAHVCHYWPSLPKRLFALTREA